MKKTLFHAALAPLLALALAVGGGAPAYAAGEEARPRKSDLNFRVEVDGGKCFINYNGVMVDTKYIDALIVINGRIIPGGGAVIRGGVSLIPLKAVTEAMGAAAEWNEAEGSVALTKDGERVTFYIDAAAVSGDGEGAATAIGGEVYVPARFMAERLGYEVGMDYGAVRLPEEQAAARGRGSLPILYIEQVYEQNAPSITGEQARGTVKAAVEAAFSKHYRGVKGEKDIELFLKQVGYRDAAAVSSRFYRVEAHFYDQWAKRFECRAYIDRFTRQMYVGDAEYGLTEDLLAYIANKYERHLPIENKPVKVVPFSDINILDDSAFIYVNFPEQIGRNALAETYYNRAAADSGRVFYSHKNISGQAIDYVVRFENRGEGEARLRIVEDGVVHTTQVYQDDAIREHMERFYNKKLAAGDLNKGLDESPDVTLQPGERYDVALRGVGDGRFFTGIADFRASGELTVTVFATAATPADGAERTAEPPTPETPYDFGYAPAAQGQPLSQDSRTQYYTTYSGVGAGYRLAAAGALRASDMTRASAGGAGWNIAFETGGSPNNINQRNGLGELVEINLFNAGASGGKAAVSKAVWRGSVARGNGGETVRLDKNAPENYGNLGNWGVEYAVTMLLENDTDTDKIFRCEIVPTNQTTWAFMAGKGNVAVTNINNRKYTDTLNRKTGEGFDTIHIGSGIKSGGVDAVAVKAGETAQLSYTYVLGTECESTVYHVWTCIDAE